MTKTKKILPIAIFIICLIGFIFAAVGIGPASFTVDEDISHTYNISINSTAAAVDSNVTVVNITLPDGFAFDAGTNISNIADSTFSNTSNILTWINVSGSSNPLINNNTNATFVFNATMATAGSYNFTIVTVNDSGITTSYLPVTINDTTFPLVTINTHVTGGNYSGSIVLNATITEDTPDSWVYFNITSSTGASNVSNASRVSSTSFSWNSTLNTSLFADGLYNITVYVNDSNNQANTTTRIFNVRFDNTNPTGTYFYCTPSSVYTGETVTCYCTGAADGGSGIATTSFTENPTTTTTGTFTEICTITDRAGNSITPTTTYTVSNSPAGNSPASGGSSTTTQTWTNTYTATEDQLTQGYTRTLSSNERVKVRVINEDHYVGVKSITTTSVTIEIASTPVEITLDIGEDAKVDVDDDGKYDIYVILNGITDGKADLTVTKIMEEIPAGESPISTTGEIKTPGETPKKKDYTFVWVIIAIIILIALGAGYKFRPKKK